MARHNMTVTFQGDNSKIKRTIVEVEKDIIHLQREAKHITIRDQDLGWTKGTRRAGYQDPTSIVGVMKNVGLAARGAHMYGLDALTRKIAKLGSTIVGSLFNPFTFIMTSLMGLGIAIKKINHIFVQSEDNLIKKSQARNEQIKRTIENTEKEKTSTEEIIKKIKQLDEKYEKLEGVQKQLNTNYIEQLKDAWGQVGIEVDKTTGKILNLSEVQGKINKQYAKRQTEALQEQIQSNKAQLDAYLTKITGKNKLFGVFRVDDMQNLFRGGANIPELKKIITNTRDLPQNIKYNDLIQGSAEEQKKVLIQIRDATNNPEDIEILNSMIKLMNENIDKEKEIIKFNNPLNQLIERQVEAIKNAEQSNKILNDIRSDAKKISQERQKKQFDEKIEPMSYQQKANAQKQRADQISQQLAAMEAMGTQLEVSIKNYGGHIGENGELVMDGLENLLDSSDVLKELHNQEQQIYKDQEQERRERLAKANADVERTKKELDEFLKSYSSKYGQNSIAGSIETQKRVNAYEEAKKERERVAAEVATKYETQRKQNREQKSTSINGQRLQQYDDYIRRQREATKLLTQYKEIQTEWSKGKQEADNLYKEARSNIQKAKEEQKNQRKTLTDFYSSIYNPIVKQQLENEGRGREYRKWQLQQEILERNGGKPLSKLQNAWVQKVLDIEDLQNQKINKEQTKQTVRTTNELARKGGFNSSIVLQGKDSIMKQNVKVSKQSRQLLKELRDITSKLRDEAKKNSVIQS